MYWVLLYGLELYHNLVCCYLQGFSIDMNWVKENKEMTNSHRKAGIERNMYSDGYARRENWKFSISIIQMRKEDKVD